MFSRQVPGMLQVTEVLCPNSDHGPCWAETARSWTESAQEAGAQHAEACTAETWMNPCKCTTPNSPELRTD